MAPILYWFDMSSPARAVLLTARALGVELELKEVNLLKKENLTTEYLKINPQHTVPTLDDNGFVVWESAAIAAYLVGKYGKDDSLYPKELKKRALVDQRLYFITDILFSRMCDIYAPLLLHNKKEICKDKVDKIIEAYYFLDIFLEGHQWLAGDQLTIADFCAIVCATSLEPVFPIDPAKFSNLTSWISRCKTLPYYDANGIGAEKLSFAIKQILDCK